MLGYLGYLNNRGRTTREAVRMSVVEGGVDAVEEAVPEWDDIVRSRQGGGKGTNHAQDRSWLLV